MNPRRVEKFIGGLALAGAVAAVFFGGWQAAAGFLLGAVFSWWSYRSLARVVGMLGTEESTGRMGAFAKMLFRWIVLVLGAFVIMRFTRINLLAAFGGLFVSAAAVVLEAIFELTYAR